MKHIFSRKIKKRLVFLFFVFLLASCTSTPATASEVIQTLTVVSTKTSLPIITPSLASTSLPTATYTPIATFTPATPRLNSDSYRLQEWSADKADLLVNQISSSLSAMENEPIYQSVYGWSYYMEQFKYLVVAEEEALLRFPNALQAESWRWNLCFNLAFSYQSVPSDAPELSCYSKLIEEGLNSGQANLKNLANWFSEHEGRFPFEIDSFDPPQGYTSSHIISLADSANLLLFERSGRFRAIGLLSSMFHYRESGTKFQLLDLTGDNYPELILYYDFSHCCGSVSTQFVYELSSGVPKQLSFVGLDGISSFVSSDYDSYITTLDPNTEHPGLLFKRHYYGDILFQPCSLRTYEKYYWIDDHFELVDTWYGIDEPSQYDRREDFCKFVINTAKEQSELNIAVKTIGDIDLTEPDVKEDQVLYRLGESHARLGDVEKAKEFFRKAIEIQPTSNQSDTKWARASQIFLNNYQKESDYYKVCSKIAQCNMHEALQQLITRIKLDSFITVTNLLKAAGVSIKSKGIVNFDSDGNIEQWLVVQYPNTAKREFWILVKGPEKIYGLFVTEISTNRPELKEFQGNNTYSLSTQNGESLFSLENLSFSGQPYILTHNIIQNYDPFAQNGDLQNSLFEESLDDISNKLLNGTDPKQIKEMLVLLNQSKISNCKTANRCDEMYYLLGLSSELAGDNQAALIFYLQLWEEYPDSLYTVMARSKLELIR
jgi:tetratricopeptide (TPR) repeat protein